MKAKILLSGLLSVALFMSCDKSDNDPFMIQPEEPVTSPEASGELPEGYFEVSFSATPFHAETRAAVSGSDSRVQHIRYIVYKSTGEYVKEKIILLPSQGTPNWPLPAVKDTLLKGEYKAVFLANVEKTMFPYSTHHSPTTYKDILTNYQAQYANARIHLPPTEFSNNTEYYWANVNFSDASPNPYILLQRIIGGARLHRNFVDTNNALNRLVSNILTNIDYRNLIRTQLSGTLANHSDGILYQLLYPVVRNRLLAVAAGLIDPLVNQLVLDLLDPVTDALYAQIGAALITQIELALEANATGNEGGLAYLGRILNPWAYGHEAIVTINNFPESIDFDLNVKSRFPANQRFKYGLKMDTGGTVNDRYVNIKGFNDVYDVRKIDIVSEGLIAGLVIDEVIDDFLLPGIFMDIDDPIAVTGPKNNFRYRADYSFLDLYLSSYTLQEDGPQGLTLSVQLGNIANIDNILNDALDVLRLTPSFNFLINLLSAVTINLLFGDIKAITVAVPLNVPLLGIENLTLSGSWNTPTQY